MKKLLLLLILFIGFQANAQVNLYDSLKNDVKQIVNKLEKPAEHVYKATKQAVITKGILKVSMSIGAAWAILAVIFYYKRRSEEDDDYQLGFGLAVILGFLMLLLCIGFFYEGITALLTPDYYTIETILELVKPGGD